MSARPAGGSPTRPLPRPRGVALPGALTAEPGAFVGARTPLERLRERFALAGDGARQVALLVRRARASARRGWRPSSPARRTPTARSSSTGAATSSRSSPTSRSSTARPALHRPARDADAARRELEPELTELARFVPALRAAAPGARARSPRPARRGATGSSRRSRGCSPTPPARRRSVLVLDDLQWADTSTALLLAHLLGDGEPARQLVLGTIRDADGHRSEELTDLLARLTRDPAFERALARAASTTPRRTRSSDARRRGRQRLLRAAPAREHRGQPVLHQGDAAQPRRGLGARACRRASRS